MLETIHSHPNTKILVLVVRDLPMYQIRTGFLELLIYVRISVMDIAILVMKALSIHLIVAHDQIV